jgi:hypothetical protein
VPAGVRGEHRPQAPRYTLRHSERDAERHVAAVVELAEEHVVAVVEPQRGEQQQADRAGGAPPARGMLTALLPACSRMTITCNEAIWRGRGRAL